MIIKDLISQLQKLDENQEIYISHEYDLKEPIIQTIDLKDDVYHLITKE